MSKDDIRDRLADSGEALAIAARSFADGKLTAPKFFAATAVHMSMLDASGQAPEAFATGVMAVLTAFRMRFDPTAYPAEYLTMLLRLGIDGAMAQQTAAMSGDSFALEHYQAIDSELGPLMLASYIALDGSGILPAQFCQPFEQLKNWTDSSATFQGKPIRATMALDILYDIASRLAAMGLISDTD